MLISIHAPHEGERPKGHARDKAARAFQSTLPTRGSDSGGSFLWLWRKISIHAPHEGERRGSQTGTQTKRIHFNPRSPRGGATCSLLIQARFP